MAFAVPQSKKSIKQNRFEFEVGGETFDVPLLKFAPVAAMEAFENGKNITGFLMTADSDRAREALRGMDSEQLDALSDAWSEASDVTPGESAGSSDS